MDNANFNTCRLVYAPSALGKQCEVVRENTCYVKIRIMSISLQVVASLH